MCNGCKKREVYNMDLLLKLENYYAHTSFFQEQLADLLSRIENQLIVIYGAGTGGCRLYDLIVENTSPDKILCFVDDDITNDKKRQCKKEILTFENALMKYDVNATYIIASFAFSLINPKLIKNGIKNIIYYPELIIDTTTINDLHLIKEKIIDTYSLLNDETSKLLFENLLKARLTGQINLLNETYDPVEYFGKQNITLNEEEVYVDAGAFNGDTIIKFTNAVDNKYNKIIAFEINEKNFEELTRNTKKFKNLVLINKGLFSENTTLRFDGSRGRCGIDESGDNEIEVVMLDNFFDITPTLIKMDIEGAEMAALMGAKKIIKELKPKLAICVYHKPEDLWDIPLYIKSLVPEYRFTLRNHAYKSTLEIVLYAQL